MKGPHAVSGAAQNLARLPLQRVLDARPNLDTRPLPPGDQRPQRPGVDVRGPRSLGHAETAVSEPFRDRQPGTLAFLRCHRYQRKVGSHPRKSAQAARHVTLARVPGRGTPKRSIRIPDATWQPALAKARRRGETLNEVIRAALERYVNDIDGDD